MAAVPSIGRASLVEAPGIAPQAAATQGLYERHAAKIQSYCHHQLGSREEAEDAVQTTFMNAFRALGRGVVPESEAAWLFKIAENVCLSRRRSSWRRNRIESPSDFDVIEEVVPGPSRQRDELIGIEDALAGMPEQQRRAILLREWQGLSYREVADELGVSQSAVETLIFRARRSLAQGLEQPDTVKPQKKVQRKSFRRALHLVDFGTIVAAIKTVLAGSAAVKATAAAVAVTAAAGTAATVGPKIHRDPVRPATPARAVVAPVQPEATAVSPVRSSSSSFASVRTTAAAVPAAGHAPMPAARNLGMKQEAAPSASAPSRLAPTRVTPAAAGPSAASPIAPTEPAAVVPAAPAVEPVLEPLPAPGTHQASAPTSAEPKREETKRDEGKREEPRKHEPANPGKEREMQTAAPAQPRTDEGKKDEKKGEGKKDEKKGENRKDDADEAKAMTRQARGNVVESPAPQPIVVEPAADRRKGGDEQRADKQAKERREPAAPAPVASPAPVAATVVTTTAPPVAAAPPAPVAAPVATPAAAPPPLAAAPTAEERGRNDRDRDRQGSDDGKRKNK